MEHSTNCPSKQLTAAIINNLSYSRLIAKARTTKLDPTVSELDNN